MRKNKNEEIQETIEKLPEVEEVKEEVKVEEQPQVAQPVQEPEVVVVSGTSEITKESYIEFYNTQAGGLKTLRQNAILCVLFCLYLYWTRGEQEISKVLANMGICCGIIIGVSLIFMLITRYVIAPKNYERSRLAGLKIDFDFSNLGIRQSMLDDKGEKQTGLIQWNQFFKAVETPKSYFFLAQRSGLIVSKAPFNEEQCAKISELVREKMGTRFKVKLGKAKKVEDEIK